MRRIHNAPARSIRVGDRVTGRCNGLDFHGTVTRIGRGGTDYRVEIHLPGGGTESVFLPPDFRVTIDRP